MAIPNKIQSNSNITVFCLSLRFGLADDAPHNWDIRKHAYPSLRVCSFYSNFSYHLLII